MNCITPEWCRQWLITADLKYMEAKATGILNDNRKFYIKLTIDGQVRQTTVSVRTNMPVWADTFYLCGSFTPLSVLKRTHLHSHACDTSKLTIEIYVNHTGRSDECVGQMQETLSVLLSKQGECLYHFFWIYNHG